MASTAVKDKEWYTKIREVKKNNAKNVANWYKDGNVNPNPYLFKSLDKDELETLRVLSTAIGKVSPDKQDSIVNDIAKDIVSFGKASGPLALILLYDKYIKTGELTITMTWNLINDIYSELNDFKEWETILVNHLNMFSYENDAYVLRLFLGQLVQYLELRKSPLIFVPSPWSGSPNDIFYNVELCMADVLIGAIQQEMEKSNPSVSKFIKILKEYPSLFLYKQKDGLWNVMPDFAGTFIRIERVVFDTIVDYILNSGEFVDKQEQLDFIRILFTAMVDIKKLMDEKNDTGFYDEMDTYTEFQSFKFRKDLPEADDLRQAYTYNQLEKILECSKRRYSEIMNYYRVAGKDQTVFERMILGKGCSIPAAIPNPARNPPIPTTPAASSSSGSSSSSSSSSSSGSSGSSGSSSSSGPAPPFDKSTFPQIIKKIIARNLGPLAYTNIHDLVEDKLLKDEAITFANVDKLVAKSKIKDVVQWSKDNKDKLDLYKKALDELTSTNAADVHTRSTLVYITKNMLERETALQSRAKELAEAIVDSLIVLNGNINFLTNPKDELIESMKNKLTNKFPAELEPWITNNMKTLESLADLLHTDYPLQKPIPPIKIPPPSTPVLSPISPPSFESPVAIPVKVSDEVKKMEQFASGVPILKAILDKNKAQFDTLYETDPFDKDTDGKGIIFYAVIANSVDILDDLHTSDPGAYKEKDAYGKTILMYAAEAGSLDALDWILNIDSTDQEVINMKSNAGKNALWYATKACQIESINKLKDYYDVQDILHELQAGDLILNDMSFEEKVLIELGSDKSKIANLEGGRRKKQTRKAQYKITRRTRRSRKY